MSVTTSGGSGVDVLQELRANPEQIAVRASATAGSGQTCELEAAAIKSLTAAQQELTNFAMTLEQAFEERARELEAKESDVVSRISRAIDYHDDVTSRHVERVGHYAALIGRSMGMSEPEVKLLQHAARLHDVGKAGIPDRILTKPNRLTPDEFGTMQWHTLYGKQIVERMSDVEWSKVYQDAMLGSRILDVPRSTLLSMAARIALTHHERWDGMGYPLGLAGLDIPLEGRITAVADVFDALSSRRPYKPAYPVDHCFNIIESESGSHFDPAIVDAFLSQRELILQTHIQLADEEE